jgi:hypothetical protein
MFDPYRKRREKAARIREKRMGAVDFSLPVDGDVPGFRTADSKPGDFVDSIVEDLVRDRSPFFDEVVKNWNGMFPDLAARPGKWVAGPTERAGGKLFLHVKSAPALFAMRPKLPSIRKKLCALPGAPARFTLHLEIAGGQAR